jgi:hypothetical protein
MGVSHWSRGRGPKKDSPYLYGKTALEQWTKDLSLPDAAENKLNQKELEALFFANWWVYSQWADARGAAVRFLRRASEELGRAGSEELERAAAEYEKELKLLTSVYETKDAFQKTRTGKKPSEWTAEHRKKERQILSEAQVFEANAVAAIEEALHSLEKTGPREVILEPVLAEYGGLDAEFPDKNPVRTDLLMRTACLRAAGADGVDYETLVMLAGHGTSFGYHPTKYLVMYNPPDDPKATDERLVKGTGCDWEWLPKFTDAEAAWKALKSSINEGIPLEAVYYDHYIFCGYRDSNHSEDRAVYTIGGWRPTGWMDWKDFTAWVQEFGRLGRYKGVVDRTPTREMAEQLLGRMVEWAKGDGRPGMEWMKEAKTGWAGLETYAADVANTDKSPYDFDGGWLGCHCINRQTSGRAGAVKWLRRVAGEFPDAAAAHLRGAADEYAQAVKAWSEFRTHLGATEGLEEAKRQWAKPENRAAGAAAIRRAMEHEKAGMARIEQALRAH